MYVLANLFDIGDIMKNFRKISKVMVIILILNSFVALRSSDNNTKIADEIRGAINEQNNIDEFEKLLKNTDVNTINARTTTGQTALYWAVSKFMSNGENSADALKKIRLLLSYRASPHKTNNHVPTFGRKSTTLEYVQSQNVNNKYQDLIDLLTYYVAYKVYKSINPDITFEDYLKMKKSSSEADRWNCSIQ